MTLFQLILSYVITLSAPGSDAWVTPYTMQKCHRSCISFGERGQLLAALEWWVQQFYEKLYDFAVVLLEMECKETVCKKRGTCFGNHVHAIVMTYRFWNRS